MLYDRITQPADFWERCCDERKMLCPECDVELCVFCEIECSGCGRGLFVKGE